MELVVVSGSGANAGGRGWTLFVDALDEAQARGARQGRKGRVGRPKRYLADIELKSLKQAEQIRKRLDRHLIAKGPDWIPDETFMKAFAESSNAVTKHTRSLRLARESEAKALAGLTGDDLDAIWMMQLCRTATMLDEDHWRELLTRGVGADVAEAVIELWKERRAANP